MRAMALNSFSKKRPRTLAMVRLPEPVTRMPSTRVFRHGLIELAAAGRRWTGWGCRRCAGNRRARSGRPSSSPRRKSGWAAQRASRMGRSAGLPKAASLRLIAPMSRPILMPISVQFDRAQRVSSITGLNC